MFHVFDDICGQRGAADGTASAASHQQGQYQRGREREAACRRRVFCRLAKLRQWQFERGAQPRVERECLAAKLRAGGAGREMRAESGRLPVRVAAYLQPRVPAIEFVAHSASSAGSRP